MCRPWGLRSTQTVAPRARRFEMIDLTSHSTTQIEIRIAKPMKAIGWAMLRESCSPLKNASCRTSVPIGLMRMMIDSNIEIQGQRVRIHRGLFCSSHHHHDGIFDQLLE